MFTFLLDSQQLSWKFKTTVFNIEFCPKEGIHSKSAENNAIEDHFVTL